MRKQKVIYKQGKSLMVFMTESLQALFYAALIAVVILAAYLLVLKTIIIEK